MVHTVCLRELGDDDDPPAAKFRSSSTLESSSSSCSSQLLAKVTSSCNFQCGFWKRSRDEDRFRGVSEEEDEEAFKLSVSDLLLPRNS